MTRQEVQTVSLLMGWRKLEEAPALVGWTTDVQQGTDLVGVDPKTSWIQFAADNVDHQIRTLDGTGPFHGMGIIGAATPGTKEWRAVRGDTSVTPDRMYALGRVPVHFYNPSSVDLSLVYEILQDFAVEDRTRKLDLLWKVSWPLRSPCLGWSGMMQTICSGAYPGKSSFTFLPMIDMDPTNMSCIFSTLHFVSSVASRYDCTPVLTFDQPEPQRSSQDGYFIVCVAEECNSEEGGTGWWEEEEEEEEEGMEGERGDVPSGHRSILGTSLARNGGARAVTVGVKSAAVCSISFLGEKICRQERKEAETEEV
ncbi:hypothetical protein ACOMHN_053827 [Nucella lapillus]